LKLLYKKFGTLEMSHTYLVEPKDNLESENPKINLEKIMGEHRGANYEI
jgi:viroplasmin and RNaseH domain-containing protein